MTLHIRWEGHDWTDRQTDGRQQGRARTRRTWNRGCCPRERGMARSPRKHRVPAPRMAERRTSLGPVTPAVPHPGTPPKGPECPAADERASKPWRAGATRHYSALEGMRDGRALPRGEPPTHQATWKEPDARATRPGLRSRGGSTTGTGTGTAGAAAGARGQARGGPCRKAAPGAAKRPALERGGAHTAV